jgi:hypothetical protein
MNDTIKELGAKLVEDSLLNEEFSFKRGLINELFPSIYAASKRMSARGIARWLDANGTKLSVATIAKALKNPTPFLWEINEEIEPQARLFSLAHKVSELDFLKNHELFLFLKHQAPMLFGVTNNDDAREALDDYQAATAILESDWFSMPEITIDACVALMAADAAEISEGDKKANEVNP